MRIAIAGGTGFVGKALTKKLLELKHEVFILTRKIDGKKNETNKKYVQWLNAGDQPAKELKGIDVFINLAGESINSGRWTEERKNRILQSRIEATEEILDMMNKLPQKPKTLINASAVGYYGTSLTEVFTEQSSTIGDDFLASVVNKWETTAEKANQLDVRTVLCRFGIILHKTEGALPRIAMPYQLFAGGTVGTGEQWVSWIHLDDVIHAILFLIEKEDIHGPVNFTSPNPVKMKEFGQTLGSVLKRPHWIPAPSFALKIVLGEMSSLVLEGQKVIPGKLTGNHYKFQYPDLTSALNNIYSI